MPKKPTVRETEHPLGKKLLAVMDELGYDFKALAAHFEVSVPSVYDWVDHGRFAKERYRQLVEWSGRSLDWWFDTADLLPPARAKEPPPKYAVTRWPFKDLAPDVYFGELTDFDRGQIQGFAMALRIASARPARRSTSA